MRTPTLGTARAALLTAGFVALGGSVAFPAGAFADTSGDQSALGGNQVNAPINAPANVCGNSLALFGTAAGSCKGGATAANQGGGHGQTSGKQSLGGGNQVTAPINAPLNACGNAIAVFGSSATDCEGGAKVKQGAGATGSHQTSGKHSVLGGNQAMVPTNVPLNICGNAAAAFGDAVAACEGGAKVKPGNDGGSGAGGNQTSGEQSVLGGNQAHVPANVPVDVCGNAIGNAVAACDGGATAAGGSAAGSGQTSGQHSIGGGNQAHIPAKVPVDVCGNAAAVLGGAVAACQGGSHGGGGGGGGYPGGSGSGSGDGYGSHAALPTVPGVTDVRQMAPAAALPTVPKLPVQSPLTAPVGASSRTAGRPASMGLPQPVNGIKDGVVNRVKGVAPVQPPVAQAAKQPAAPAKAPIKAPIKPPVKAPVALPNLSELPVVGDVEVPAAAQQMRPAAATEPLSSGMTDDSLYVLALGAMLAGTSAVIAVTRRVRLRRR